MVAHRVVVPLSFDKPPLSLNDRKQWYQKAPIVRALREEVVMRLRSKRIRRPAEHVVVEFHYRPRDNRTRDTDNLIATIKPLVDALTPGRPAGLKGKKVVPAVPGYGLVPDDDSRYVTRPEAVIHPASGTPSCWLELTITYQETPNAH